MRRLVHPLSLEGFKGAIRPSSRMVFAADDSQKEKREHRRYRKGCVLKKTVGFYGAPFRSYLIDAFKKSEYLASWSILDINPSDKLEEKCQNGSLLAKVKRTVQLFWRLRRIDVLCLAFVPRYASIYTRMARFWNVKTIYLWAGSDVWHLIQEEYKANAFQKADLHLAAGQHLIDELASFGISSKLLVVPVPLPTECASMPEKHAVLLSLPDERAEFYGYSTLMKVVKAYPDVPFHVVRSNSPQMYDEPNAVFHGIVSQDEMNRIYDEVSIVIRYPDHDGMSFMLIEGLIKGKKLISKHLFPHARLATSFEDICLAMDEILDRPPSPDMDGHAFALEYFSQRKWGNELGRHLESIVDKQGN